jgi:hypothetical protein
VTGTVVVVVPPGVVVGLVDEVVVEVAIVVEVVVAGGAVGTVAPTGRHSDMPGNNAVATVAELAVSSAVRVTFARLAISVHESLEITV